MSRHIDTAFAVGITTVGAQTSSLAGLSLCASQRSRPATVQRPRIARCRVYRTDTVASAGDDSDSASAEDEAPSDSFVPPGTASAIADKVTGTTDERKGLIVEVLSLASATARGQFATGGQKSRVEDLVAKLEDLNPTEAPVETDDIDGQWVLLYSSNKIFSGNPLLSFAAKPVLEAGQIRQTIRVDEGKLISEVEVTAFPEVTGVVKTTARVTPVGGERLEVGIEKTTVSGGSVAGRFDLGGLSFDIPVEDIYQRLRGSTPDLYLDTTYLDEYIRISRSKNGKLFIFSRC